MPSYNLGTVTLVGAKIMLTRLPEKVEGSKAAFPTKRPVEIYLEVSDVDTYHDDVEQRGVKITAPLGAQWWGDRTFKVVDPYGYELWFYRTVGEPKPPKGAKIV